MNAKDIEEVIRIAAPARIFAETFSKDIGRDVVIKKDLIFITETKERYDAKRRMEFSAKDYVSGEKNDWLVQQEYYCDRGSLVRLKNTEII